MMNELANHLSFVDTGCVHDVLGAGEDTYRNWIQLFYVARCLFSEESEFPVKGELAPLLERREIFDREPVQRKEESGERLHTSNMAESLDLGRIASLSQISSILPREFLVYSEELFYKKLINRELFKKEFNQPETFSVADLVYGQGRELNRRQKVYILFDNSSSMNGEKLNKLFAAKAICIEYLRRVQREGPQIYFRSFNDKISPVKRIDRPEGIRGLIRHIVDLNTCECFQTRIGEALTSAIRDIRSDPAFSQAEIIMITDGIGDVPEDIEERLGSIQFHMVLISGLDIDRFLRLYPDRETLEDAMIHMSPGNTFELDSYITMKRIYRLRDIAKIFVRIPSLLGERFRFSNTLELERVREMREALERRLGDDLLFDEQYEIYNRIKYLTEYLRIMLSRAASREMKDRITGEIEGFRHLARKVAQDEWFAHNMETRVSQAGRKRFTRGAAAANGAHASLIRLLLTLLGAAVKRPYRIADRVYQRSQDALGAISIAYHHCRTGRRLRRMNRRISRVLNT